MAKKISIAIDGPAASGKSTTARLLAEKLGYIYIDTGAMYRAATLAVLRSGINIADEKAVEKCVKANQIVIRVQDGKQHTFLNEEDVTEQLRTPAINRAISAISSYKGVREIMVAQQRRLAVDGGVVMDGRDIGTVVLPHAELKVFLVASLEERARRRLKELKSQNARVTLQEVMEEIRRRDSLDASRSQAPLKQADDARLLDTTTLNIEEQVAKIYQWAREIIEKRL